MCQKAAQAHVFPCDQAEYSFYNVSLQVGMPNSWTHDYLLWQTKAADHILKNPIRNTLVKKHLAASLQNANLIKIQTRASRN